jgi:hypothetical protein
MRYEHMTMALGVKVFLAQFIHHYICGFFIFNKSNGSQAICALRMTIEIMPVSAGLFIMWRLVWL